jgi:hypothetical protein
MNHDIEIVGNDYSSTVSADGEVVQFFWPNTGDKKKGKSFSCPGPLSRFNELNHRYAVALFKVKKKEL